MDNAAHHALWTAGDAVDNLFFVKAVAFLFLFATTAYAAPVYYLADVRVADAGMSKARVLLQDSISIQHAVSYARGLVDQRFDVGTLATVFPPVVGISRVHECTRVRCFPVFGLYSGRAPH